MAHVITSPQRRKLEWWRLDTAPEGHDGWRMLQARILIVVQFDQPGKKKSRRVARSKKALAGGAAPLNRLRPAVRCPSQRYNIRIRGASCSRSAELATWRIRRVEC